MAEDYYYNDYMLYLQRAAVYVCTKKQREGLWFNLWNYATWQEFDDDCRNCLGNTEDAPEFIFTRPEYIPKEYYHEEYISPKIFQILSFVKTWDGRKLKALDIYIKEHNCIPCMADVEAFDACYKPLKTFKSKVEIMIKFKLNTLYVAYSPCNTDCRWIYNIIKRTAKTVTICGDFVGGVKQKRLKIKVINGVECVEPLGTYSMAPTLFAANIIK